MITSRSSAEIYGDQLDLGSSLPLKDGVLVGSKQSSLCSNYLQHQDQYHRDCGILHKFSCDLIISALVPCASILYALSFPIARTRGRRGASAPLS